MTELENHLEKRDYIFILDRGLKTAVMVDFMSQIRKYPTKLRNFNELFDIAINVFTNASVAQIDIIYDSYLENSIKECERIRRRRDCESLEFVNLKATSPIPVQIDRFWASEKKQRNIAAIAT